MIEKLIDPLKEISAFQKDRYLSGALTFQDKSSRLDPVSDVDVHSQKMLVEAIRTAFPEATVIGEEDDPQLMVEPSELCFVIDPLDGTLNYKQKLGIWNIGVGLLKGGRFHEGLVAIPLTDEIRCSTRWTSPRILARSPAEVVMYGIDAAFRFKSIPGITAKMRSIGTTVLSVQLCTQPSFEDRPCYDFVAMGRPYVWDIAAPAAFLKEVGGAMIDAEGRNLIEENMFEYFDDPRALRKERFRFVASASADLARTVAASIM